MVIRLTESDINADIEAFRGFFEDSLAVNFSIDCVSEAADERLDTLLRFVKDGSAAVFGDVSGDGHIRGFVWTYERIFFGERQLHIDELYVAPQFRKEGIGNALLTAAEEYACGQGISTVNLMVTAVNESAVGLYEKHGFIKERFFMEKR